MGWRALTSACDVVLVVCLGRTVVCREQAWCGGRLGGGQCSGASDCADEPGLGLCVAGKGVRCGCVLVWLCLGCMHADARAPRDGGGVVVVVGGGGVRRFAGNDLGPQIGLAVAGALERVTGLTSLDLGGA